MNIRRNKVLLLLLSLLLITSLISGCVRVKEEYREKDQDNDDLSKIELPDSVYPMEIEDGFGNKVTLDGKPWRIISLAPNHTEILFKLGLGNRIVGVDSYSDYPAEAKEIEKVGDSETINIEKIIELDPDLVIQYGPGAEDVNKSLRDAGITLLSYEPESIDDVINLITELGKITDTMRTAKMETVVMQSKLEYITQVVEDAEKTKVFYEVWNDPLMTAGPGTFLNELITLAGGENIAADAEEGYPLFDTEQLIEKNPDVYIATKDSDKEEIINRPGYDEINAINNDRIYLLEPNIISRPGPRIVDGLELMAKTLHPELFE